MVAKWLRTAQNDETGEQVGTQRYSKYGLRRRNERIASDTRQVGKAGGPISDDVQREEFGLPQQAEAMGHQACQLKNVSSIRRCPINHAIGRCPTLVSFM